jgi:nitric oxide reductase NorQ protein
MAADQNLELIQVACNEDTSSADLLGRFLIKNSETLWQDGPVIRAVRKGALLYLDEIAEAREDVVVLLHSLTDH